MYADGREESEPVTIVEFPAYENHLEDVRAALRSQGFPEDALHVTGMLEEIHSGAIAEPAPPGARYDRRVYSKQAAAGRPV